MSAEPSISFRELLSYTDYLANRWLNYFTQHPTALDIDVGNKKIRELVAHIFQVEQFFACRLLHKEPTAKLESFQTEDLRRLHKEAQAQLLNYATSASREELYRTQSFGPVVKVSSRKILSQTVLHGIHHRAQIAMEVRQAGFPTEKPQDIILTDVME